jgi:para-nitrobenzyl esterase
MKALRNLCNIALHSSRLEATKTTPANATCSILAAAFIFAGSTTVHAQAERYLFVQTPEGQVYEEVRGAIASAKAIHYAAAPVGGLRWRAPQPPESRSEILGADDYGPSCPCFEAGRGSSNEDCLTLNIFTPSEIEHPLPVIVWIGSASAPHVREYELAHLLQEGIVLVTLNYRLSAFGWFMQRGLKPDDLDEPAANYGMMDQIAALRWINVNIGAFRGDANNVTLVGSHLGGASIAMLMLSKDASGLFQKAIVHSAPLRAQARSAKDAELDSETLAHAVTLEKSPSISTLRKIPSSAICKSQLRLTKDRSSISLPQIIDGRLVAQDIADGFASGTQPHIPLIVGSGYDRANDVDETDLIEPARNHDQPGSKAAMDRLWTEPARLIARLHSTTGSPTYRYVITRPALPSPDLAPGSELNLLLGGSNRRPFSTPSERDPLTLLAKFLVNFVKTSNPNDDGLPHWEPWSPSESTLVVSDTELELRPNPDGEQLDRLETMRTSH